MIYTDFDQIPLFNYGLIMADFPWQFESWSEKGNDRSHEKHYDLMGLDDLYDIPMGDYVGADAVLWFWTTVTFADHAHRMIEHWGFKYVTMGFWGKVQKSDPTAPRMGSGHVLRECGEPFIIAKIGSPNFPDNAIPGMILEPRREPGRKPDVAYDMAARMAPAGRPMLDMFSRQVRPGWDQFGNEVEKFPTLSKDDEKKKPRCQHVATGT